MMLWLWLTVGSLLLAFELTFFAHFWMHGMAGEDDAKVMDHWQFPVGWACSILICAVLDAVALSFTDPALIAPLSGFTLVL